MPIYQFKNKLTEEIIEKTLRISELDNFKKENPDLEQFFSNGIMFGDPTRLMNGIKPPADFQKYILGRMAASIPGNTLHDRKFSIPKEF